MEILTRKDANPIKSIVIHINVDNYVDIPRIMVDLMGIKVRALLSIIVFPTFSATIYTRLIT